MTKKTIIFSILIIFLVVGLGGVVFERVVFPYLSTWPLFRNLPVVSSRTPLIITRREEIRIQEGINYLETVNRVKGSLATIYLHEAGSEPANFRAIAVVSGVIASSDGLILAPSIATRSNLEITVLVSGGEPKKAQILTSDALSGVTILKIESTDLPVIKQGFSRELQVGERLLAVWITESPTHPDTRPLTLTNESFAMPGFLTTYELGRFNAFLPTTPAPASEQPGAVIVDKDGSFVGFASQIGKDLVILRSEDLKLVLDNFLDDRKITWPSVKVSYEILGPSQTRLLNLPQETGVLIKSASSVLQPNDFVYAVDGQALTLEEGFQEILLAKKAGDKVKLKLIRQGQDIEIELIL